MKCKYKVFFRRVSTSGQDLSMQISADAVYRQKYLSNEIKIIDEHGISANKLKITDRPKIQSLISLIQNNQVDIIFAFDRSRLFRDFYESNYFFSICKKNDVTIFFTSAGNGHQATDNSLLEGVLNIVGDVEGKNIARRTEEARKRYPPRKLGYLKHKETKRFLKDSTKENILSQYFSDLAEVKNHIHLEELLQEYKKKLKVNPLQLLKIAKDPFYAGYDLSNGQNKLSHVSPYLDINQFKVLQGKTSIFTIYTEKVNNLKELNIYQPTCGICRKPMLFRFELLSDLAYYTCSRKHSKVLITTTDLTSIINSSLEKVIANLDVEKLLKDSRYCFNKINKHIEEEQKILATKKKNILENIIMENDEITNWRSHPLYKELSILEAQQESILAGINEKQILLTDNNNLSKLVTDYLDDCKLRNPFFLNSMLIQNVFVFHNEVNLVINKFDYIQNLHTHYILNGEELQ